MTTQDYCLCGHNRSVHPTPWECRDCDCEEYDTDLSEEREDECEK